MAFKKVTHVPIKLWPPKKWAITWVEDTPGEYHWRWALVAGQKKMDEATGKRLIK